MIDLFWKSFVYGITGGIGAAVVMHAMTRQRRRRSFESFKCMLRCETAIILGRQADAAIEIRRAIELSMNRDPMTAEDLLKSSDRELTP